MTQVDSQPNFGTELKDAFKPVNSWVLGGIAWLDDIQQFYRDRALIEKDYAMKLSSLAKRYHEKKAKKASVLSVGEMPAITPGSLERWVSLVKYKTPDLERKTDSEDLAHRWQHGRRN